MNHTRRGVLGGVGLLALGTLAGCLSEPQGDADDGGGDGNHSGYAAFFSLYDWANEVGGDAFSFENPVDVGEMGHGWEPDGELAVDVAETDAFVYLDSPEFAWAQDLATTLESDYPEVALIDGMEGLGEYLLPGGDGGGELPEPDDADVFDGEEVEIAEFDVVDPGTGDVVAYWHDGHWHGGFPDVPLEGTASVGGVVVDTEDRVLPLGDDEPFQIRGRVREGAQEVVEVDSDGEIVRVTGVEEGRTQVVFELVSDGEVLFDTTNDGLPVEVVEEAGGESPEFSDPHVWVDPVIATEIVGTIADRLGEVDPENAASFEENAAAYTERLEGVDEAFAALVEDAEREIGVVASHDSFRYLEARYGFELYSPVGIAPDDAESLDDVAGMIEVVEEHGIDTVLYDPFESPDPDEELPSMVELIIENSDASEAAPLTAVEGTTPEWNEAGWGWVEQMEEINIPSLRQALGAE
ncbi:metal ABC transporter substrate-binding protein [Natronorarus salvus]|uniref:metal ABC transporter substrate-binding protein n=1 Tax=Natronorarus salvus TaxID=3117733 RepID=UPI002F26B975